jgi:putative intracellular protease/amidase
MITMRLRPLLSGIVIAIAALSAAFSAYAETGKGKILVLMSNARSLTLQGGASTEVGFYLNEFATPAQRLVAEGYELVVATPNGARPDVDARSVDAKFFGGSVEKMNAALRFAQTHPAVVKPLSLDRVEAGGLQQYAGVFIPGGHAPIVDLAPDARVGAILRHFQENRKPTAAICHGPLALLAAQTNPASFSQELAGGRTPKSGNFAYAGYRMTVFSTVEERQVEQGAFKGRVQYYPEDGLRAAGAAVVVGEPWKSHVIVDRELITGQQPFSDDAFVEAFLTALKARAGRTASTIN